MPAYVAQLWPSSFCRTTSPILVAQGDLYFMFCCTCFMASNICSLTDLVSDIEIVQVANQNHFSTINIAHFYHLCSSVTN